MVCEHTSLRHFDGGKFFISQISPKGKREEFDLEDASLDRKESKRVEQYRVSGRAIYFPGFPGDQYLPFTAVTSALSKNTAISVKGTCGKQLIHHRDKWISPQLKEVLKYCLEREF